MVVDRRIEQVNIVVTSEQGVDLLILDGTDLSGVFLDHYSMRGRCQARNEIQ